MPRRMYLFFTLFIIATLGICLFTSYIYLQSFYATTKETIQIYTLGLFLTAAFVVAFMTSRHSPAKRKNVFYIFVMTIAGYALYVFILSIPLSVVLVGSSIAGTIISPWVPATFFITGLVLGIIGNIQSWSTSTTSYSVTIPDLPEWWHDKTGVLITDTHFGIIRKHTFAKKIVSTILSLSPDVVFHGGDFYDGPDIQTQKITAIWKDLAEKIPVFYTPGNHEQYGNYQAFIKSVSDAGITVLEDKKVLFNGIQIAGITYRSKNNPADATTAINSLSLDPSISTILINHPPTFHEAAHEAGVSLMLSGHTHNGQFWPDNYIAKTIYRTYTYGLHRYKTMFAITSRGVGTAGPPMRLFNPPEYVVITFKKG